MHARAGPRRGPCPRTRDRGIHTLPAPRPDLRHPRAPVRLLRAPAARAWPWLGPSGSRYRSAEAPPSLSGGPRHALWRRLALRAIVRHRKRIARSLLNGFRLGLGMRVLLDPRLRGGEYRRRLLLAEAGHGLEGLEPRLDDTRRGKEAVLHEPLDELRTDARELCEGRPAVGQLLLREAALLLNLTFALDVHVQAGQLGREAGVLPALPDGKRELVGRDDHKHRPRPPALVGRAQGHRRNLGRRQRPRHEGRRIRRPLDDVDLLAPQLAADHLDPGAAEPHAGANGIDIALGGHHGNLGALPGLARGSLDLHNALGDLGDLGLEESDEESRVGARQEDLRPLGGLLDLLDEGADAIVRVVALPGNLLPLRDHRLGLAEVHDDVAFLDPVHRAADDLALLVDEVRVDGVALGIPHALQYDLLGRLRRDAAELLGREPDLDLVLELGFGVELPRLGERDLELGVRDGLDHLLSGEDL